MAKKVSVYNLKGGVGKTFLVYSLAIYMHHAKPDARILVVDMDQQSNATALFSSSEKALVTVNRNISALFAEEPYNRNPYDIIFKTNFDNIFLLPSTLALSVHEIKAYTIINSSTRLKQFLEMIDDEFDYIIIDNPPALNIYTTNSFMAAEHVVIPIVTDNLALYGLTLLANTFQKIKTFNTNIKLVGMVPNMIDNRYKAHKQILEILLKVYGDIIVMPPLGRRSMYQRMIDRRLTYEKFLRYTAYKEDVESLGETMSEVLRRIDENYNADLEAEINEGVI